MSRTRASRENVPDDGGSTPSKILGRIVRARPREPGLMQADLEGDFDLHQTYVSKIEQGAREPRLGMLIHLERSLRLPPGELVRRVRQELEGSDEP